MYIVYCFPNASNYKKKRKEFLKIVMLCFVFTLLILKTTHKFQFHGVPNNNNVWHSMIIIHNEVSFAFDMLFRFTESHFNSEVYFTVGTSYTQISHWVHCSIALYNFLPIQLCCSCVTFIFLDSIRAILVTNLGTKSHTRGWTTVRPLHLHAVNTHTQNQLSYFTST